MLGKYFYSSWSVFRIRVEHPIDEIVTFFSVFINQLLSDNGEHRLFILDPIVSCSRIFTERMLPPAQRERKDETQGINVDCVRWSEIRQAIEYFRCEPSVGTKRSEAEA